MTFDIHKEYIALEVKSPDWMKPKRFYANLDDNTSIDDALAQLYVDTQKENIDPMSKGSVDVFDGYILKQWLTRFPNMTQSWYKQDQVTKAELKLHKYWKELCVTKELALHGEDVSGWNQGFIPEPNWDVLWDVYKSAEEFISEWPLEHNRYTFMEFEDAIEQLTKFGTYKLIMVDDGQDKWVLQWKGDKAELLGYVWDGTQTIQENEIDLKTLKNPIIKSGWVQLVESCEKNKMEYESLYTTFGGFYTCQFLYGYTEDKMTRLWKELIESVSTDDLLILRF